MGENVESPREHVLTRENREGAHRRGGHTRKELTTVAQRQFFELGEEEDGVGDDEGGKRKERRRGVQLTYVLGGQAKLAASASSLAVVSKVADNRLDQTKKK